MTMSDLPAAEVARLAAAGQRVETPCGDGVMVWRIWSPAHRSGVEPLVLFHGGFGSWTHWFRKPGERFHLTGFSFGGLIGGHVAAHFGERCRSLTLVGAGGLGLRRSAMAPLKSWRHLSDEADRLAVHRENLALLMLADPARIDDLAVYLQSENASRGRINSPPIAMTDTLTRMLPRVRGRLAGIWGERDATAMEDLPARARLLRGIQGGAPFIVIADAGHWVQYEAPDAFNATLLELLAGVPT